MTTTVRAFMNSEWLLYRQLRLAALKDSPDAFGSTYSQALGYPDVTWQSRLTSRISANDLALIARVDDIPAGLAWGRIEPTSVGVAHLYQMWVAPLYRGRKVARGLLNEVKHWAADEGAHTLELAVTEGNSPARRLYESAGFKPYGEPEPLRPGASLQVRNMRLLL